MTSRADLRQYVREHGSYEREVNDRIYLQHFSSSPRYVFRAVNEKYHLSDRRVCDIGCGWGSTLVFCGPGSYGLDIHASHIEFARSLGLAVHRRDVVHDDIRDLPPAEIAYCSAILEHVEAPHVLLRKIHLLLEPRGILVVYVPTLPLIPALAKLPRYGSYFKGHEHSDHINAFVPDTLRFTCERAGFETIEMSPFFPSTIGILNRISLARRLPDGVIYIGQKLDNWEYQGNATRRVAVTPNGFVMRGVHRDKP